MSVFDAETHDKESKLDIRGAVIDRLVKDNDAHDPEYYGAKRGEVHVSSLYACHRGTVMKMLGMEPPPKSEFEKMTEVRKLGVFKAGHLFEDFIMDALGDAVTARQVEYRLDYNGIRLVGRSDGYVKDGSSLRVHEVKSVHSNSFWHREKRGELVAWQNQIQLQTYLWLERKLHDNHFDGVFTYVSKDDCTIISVPVKYNQGIIDDVVIPTLNTLSEAFKRAGEATSTNSAVEDALCMVEPPLPVVFDPVGQKYKTNWLAEYCDYHTLCVGSSWKEDAKEEIKRMNKTL